MKNKKEKPANRESLDKAAIFSYSYIRNMGNGSAAAREVYGLEGNSAAQKASQMLTNSKVQKIIGEFLDAQRESLKKFTEQGNYFLTVVTQRLIQIITDPEKSDDTVFQAMERLMRLGGFEMSESVTMAKIQAKSAGRGRAELPGLPPPGVQPGAPSSTLVAGNVDSSRKVIFMLSPPPLPPGGVPTPALEAQWREMGWKPGIATAPAQDQNVVSAKPPTVPPRAGPLGK
jgi:hypothetical protein